MLESGTVLDPIGRFDRMLHFMRPRPRMLIWDFEECPAVRLSTLEEMRDEGLLQRGMGDGEIRQPWGTGWRSTALGRSRIAKAVLVV